MAAQLITPSHASIGKPVHYIDPSTREHHAAYIIKVNENGSVYLMILFPSGMKFEEYVPQDPEAERAGTWHWVERG